MFVWASLLTILSTLFLLFCFARHETMQDLGMSEDEQLRQALEASVQSHHDLLQSTGSGARSPALPQHLETDLQTRRIQGAPVAMVAPFASLEVAAAVLQALYAASPVRTAFLASRPVDTRGSDLSNYWKGAPLTDSSSTSADQMLDVHIDLTRRIQTLFAFATLSQRPLCVIKDVTALTPSEVIARGSDHTAPAKVASLYYEFLVDNFSKHISSVTDLILSTPSASPAPTDALWMSDALFLSSGAAALTTSTTDKPKIEQQRSFIQLRHDSINADAYSCLRAALASDGEGALLTRPARVISMGIDHALPCTQPFRIQERIHLDSLMWDRRGGQRLDGELRDLEMVRLDAMRSDLEARKRKLGGDAGRSSTEVLSGAKRYFEQIVTVDETDTVRTASLAEAAPQIAKILDAVQADLTATDQLIGQIRQRIDAKRLSVAERATQEAENPEWNQLAYDLCAVLVHEAGRVATLVKQEGQWWKISGGKVTAVTKEEVVMGRAEDASLGVFWIVYAKVDDGEAGQEEGLIGEEMTAAVADDNLTYESELLSLIRSEAASPSSTDVNVGVEEIEVDGREAEQADMADVAMAGESQREVGSVVEEEEEEEPKSPRTS